MAAIKVVLGVTRGGGSALPKGAQLHHVLLLESLRGLGPKAEQLGCSWLCGERGGVKRGCSRSAPSPRPLSPRLGRGWS